MKQKRIDAVVLYNGHPNIKLVGSIFDAFEYYFVMLEHNPNIKLFLINFNKTFIDYLYNIMEERYILDDLKWKENIIKIPLTSLIHFKFNKVLIVDYTTIPHTRGFLATKKIIIITEYYTKDKRFQYNKKLYDDVVYYTEMPFEYKDKDYRIKMLFNRFKPLKHVQKGIFIHSPNNINLDIIPTMLKLDTSKPIYYKKEKHMSNLFEHFDEYIYYHVNEYFDTHPRMPLECTYYNKSVKYIRSSDDNYKDGSYYRFIDLKENGLKDRSLNKNDEIIQQFI